MEPFDFQPSIHLLYGENRIDQLGELSKEVADPSRVLVVTDPGIASAGLLKRAMASLETAEITVFAFQQVQALMKFQVFFVNQLRIHHMRLLDIFKQILKKI